MHSPSGATSVVLLGPVRVHRDGVDLPVPGPLRRALLALLLLENGRMLPVPAIVRALWGGTPPATAPAQVRAAVVALRRALRPVAEDLIVTHPAGYRVEIPVEMLDVERFRTLVREARPDLDAAPRAARERLVRALALWEGEPLGGASAEFVAGARAGLAEERLAAEEDLLDAELRLGATAAVLPRLTTLVVDHPLRERVHGMLMLALHRSGRRADALAVYRRLRATLAAGQGIEPGRPLARLHEACLRDDPALEAALDPGVDTALERVPALDPVPAVDAPGAEPSGGPAGAPADAGPARVPAQLPVAPAPFVGRRTELGWLDGAMRPGGLVPPLVVISGPPGVGKSGLALFWAHRNRARFPDGQLYLDLHGHDGSEPVPPQTAVRRLLSLLGVPPDRHPVDPADLAALYRSTVDGRRMLLVLDNAADTAQLTPLIPGSPTCAVLATGRRRPDALAVDHAVRALALEPLGGPAGVALLRAVAGADRVAGDPVASARLAALCGGLPLALRIAGAKLTTRPFLAVDELGRRLAGDGRLAELAVAGHHHSVDAAIGYSYRDLDAPSATLLRALAVHPGDTLTVDHAAVLAGATRADAERRIDDLAVAHLVVLVGTGRFRLHDLIRAFLTDRLRDDPDTAAAATARLIGLYVTVTATAVDPAGTTGTTPGSTGPHDVDVGETDALAWLDAERPVLEPLLRLAVDAGLPAAWRLSLLLGRYYVRRGGWSEYLPVAGLGVAAAALSGDPEAPARARANLGMAHLRVRDLDAASRELGAAGSLAATLGSLAVAGRALNNLAIVEHTRRRHPAALDAYRRAARLQTRAGDIAGAGQVLSNIGETYIAMGDLRRALRYHVTAVRVRRRFGGPSDVAYALANLGGVQVRLGHADAAAATLDEAWGLARGSGDRPAQAQVLGLMGQVRALLGDPAGAVRDLTRGARVFRELDDPHYESVLLAQLADVHIDAGDLPAARGALERAAALRGRAPDEPEQGRLRLLRARLDGQVDSRRTTRPSTRSTGT